MPLQRWVMSKLGRRGVFLASVGFAWLVVGWGSMAGQRPRLNLGGVVGVVLNSSAWGWLWVVAGLVAVVAAFARRTGDDGPGFVALQLPPVLWLLTYLASWVISWFTDYGRATDVVVAAVWAAVIAAVYVVSGWPETTER